MSSEREKYPNLPSDVAILHCTKESPMPLKIADRVVELKQLWIHDDADEIGESDTGRFVQFHCPNCGHKYWCDLGD